MGLALAAFLKAGSFLAALLLFFTGKRLLIFQIRRGAPFLTQLRLQWIAMEQEAKIEKRRTATVVQLLGSVDDIVSPEDTIDLVAGQNFFYLDVPSSGHANVILMDETPEGRARKEVFRRALSCTEDELNKEAALPVDEKPPEANKAVDRVIFVIHGIRDAGY